MGHWAGHILGFLGGIVSTLPPSRKQPAPKVSVFQETTDREVDMTIFALFS